jgi:hypothetical protein
MQLNCPKCSRAFRVLPAAMGKTVACPHCAAAIEAPPLAQHAEPARGLNGPAPARGPDLPAPASGQNGRLPRGAGHNASAPRASLGSIDDSSASPGWLAITVATMRAVVWIAYACGAVFVMIVWLTCLRKTENTTFQEIAFTSFALLGLVFGYTVCRGIDSATRWR